MKSYIPVLTIAGSDSSGGAGIQADIKTMSALGCYGMSAITAITAQNTKGVSDIQGISPSVVAAQIDMVYSDIYPLAVKTGMLYSSEIVEAIVDRLINNQAKNIVVDPVMVSTSGSQLISDDGIEAIVKLLFPIASVITPNRIEAKMLTGTEDVALQTRRLKELGAKNILLKGGDTDSTDYKIDYLITENSTSLLSIKSSAIDTVNTHGTGCTLSSAIACYMAMGNSVEKSIKKAKRYITYALFAGKDVKIGGGHGPVNHFFHPDKLKLRDYEDYN